MFLYEHISRDAAQIEWLREPFQRQNECTGEALTFGPIALEQWTAFQLRRHPLIGPLESVERIDDAIHHCYSEKTIKIVS